MALARPQIDDDLLLLSNSEWIELIDEYIKSEENRQIAKMYYINGIPQIDIAMEFNLSRSTVRDRLHSIINIIEKNAKKKS